MAGGGGGRSLEQTPTWAVAAVCFVLVAISIVIEHIIHLIGKVYFVMQHIRIKYHKSLRTFFIPFISFLLQWFKSKKKRALFEALEKIKAGSFL